MAMHGEESNAPLRVVAWGVYDLGKPRMRLILSALEEAGVRPHQIHKDVFAGVDDKTEVRGILPRLLLALRWAAAYPLLIWRYMRAPAHDVVLVGYLGHLDMLILAPFARMRGAPIVWDAFLSLYDTVAMDRRLARPTSLAARLIQWIEHAACRRAARIVLDTAAQARLFDELYAPPPGKTAAIMVGAEAEAFPPAPQRAAGDAKEILFYGQFIPLHGVETIVAAARLAADRPWRWRLVGRGQTAPSIAEDLAANPVPAIDWTPWVPYEELKERIAAADVCLGVFGDSDKAGRVIPNKVFQILSSGRPLVTRDGPGMRELADSDRPGLRLTPPADPEAIVAALDALLAEPAPAGMHDDLVAAFAPSRRGAEWRALLTDAARPA